MSLEGILNKETKIDLASRSIERRTNQFQPLRERPRLRNIETIKMLVPSFSAFLSFYQAATPPQPFVRYRFIVCALFWIGVEFPGNIFADKHGKAEREREREKEREFALSRVRQLG